jgi:phosphoribosylamine--glycine ligase
VKVLVIGGGGREHALISKLKESPREPVLYCAPGNAGIAREARCLDLKTTDQAKLLRFAKAEGIDLTVVGPEEPLVHGIVDRFREEGLRIFGPTARAAELEGSKAFAKGLMSRSQVPTANFRVFRGVRDARDYLRASGVYPVVLKADGLASGKGVIVARSEDEAFEAVESFLVKKRFGPAGEQIVVEDFLRGEELSMMALTDGRNILPFPPVQDHKTLLESGQGPNTGGMGAYAPAAIASRSVREQVESQVFVPILHALAREERPFQGLLYAGLMVTAAGPRVLEFNVRFGDPETQAVLPLLQGDLLELLNRCTTGGLQSVEFDWSPRASVSVVLASRGYPEKPQVGFPIQGLGELEREPDVKVYHAGTALTPQGEVVTSGGRVLAVTALGENLTEARDRAYRAVGRIQFEGRHFRSDIGQAAANRGPRPPL